MKYLKYLAVALTTTGALSLFILAACGGGATATSQPARSPDSNESGEHRGASESSERGEHSESSKDGERGEEAEDGEHDEGAGEGDESGVQYALDETYDEVRAGARLTISYDKSRNAFTGTVENTTSDTLKRVRVEVHLSNGIELGPTTPVDLGPRESATVTFKAPDQPFKTWSAHPEVG